MKRYNIHKKSIIITSITLLLLVVVSATLAYVFTKTSPLDNTFPPSQVSCAVVENGNKAVSGALVNIPASKENVQIENTGNTDDVLIAQLIRFSGKEPAQKAFGAANTGGKLGLGDFA